jgi:WD40 repeat protein
MQVEGDDTSSILKKYVLLPKFIDLMVNFCNKKSDKSKAMTNIETWKLGFNAPPVSKVQPGSIFKLHGNGTFTFEIRKENAVHNMSCTLIKKNIAQNNKFVLLASSTEIFVFSKEKLMNCVGEMKPVPGYNTISRHSIAFEVHSLDFSPNDKSLFCAAGLHNVTLLNINNEGHITRSSYRYNVSNFYINKIKLTKMGIFIGVDKEIRVLNYTCRQILSIRAQEANTIIREWTIFEKAAGCQVLFVCPNGNIFTSDILPSDEDKK